MSDCRIGEAMEAIMEISKQYPSEQLILTVKAGTIQLGIPSGPIGDEAYKAWMAALPAFEVRMS